MPVKIETSTTKQVASAINTIAISKNKKKLLDNFAPTSKIISQYKYRGGSHLS